jgi:hypothetical protein
MKGVGPGRVRDILDHEPRYVRVERQRRYLLTELPEGVSPRDEHAQITDNYITNTRLRLRKSRWVPTGEWSLKLSQKQTPAPPDFGRALLTTLYLDRAEYEALSIFEANELRKNRYYLRHEGRLYSVNVYLGDLHGLILAETDCDTDEELDALAKPPFALLDVTRDELFTGARLVELTAEELREELKRVVSSQ